MYTLNTIEAIKRVTVNEIRDIIFINELVYLRKTAKMQLNA